MAAAWHRSYFWCSPLVFVAIKENEGNLQASKSWIVDRQASGKPPCAGYEERIILCTVSDRSVVQDVPGLFKHSKRSASIHADTRRGSRYERPSDDCCQEITLEEWSASLPVPLFSENWFASRTSERRNRPVLFGRRNMMRGEMRCSQGCASVWVLGNVCRGRKGPVVLCGASILNSILQSNDRSKQAIRYSNGKQN